MKKSDEIVKKGKELLDKGHYKKALFTLLNALKTHADWPDLRNYLGLCYNFLGDLNEAEKEFLEAVSLNPGYVEAHLNLALTYNEMGRLKDAAEEFDIASKLEKKKGKSGYGIKEKLVKTHIDLGDIYTEIGNFADAVEAYKKADKIAGNYADIKIKIARTYLNANKYANAVLYLKKALEINKNLEEGHFLLGLAYYKSRRMSEARKEWNEVLRINPKSDKVKPYLNLVK
ncbi:MAG: tetratricopeptide repeat protein [bacterium]|nr:tetratricopeptide repeat protein [bacterium]